MAEKDKTTPASSHPIENPLNASLNTDDDQIENRLRAMQAFEKKWPKKMVGRRINLDELEEGWELKVVEFPKKAESIEEFHASLDLLDHTIWQTPQRTFALRKILDILENEEKNPDIRRAIIEWLEERTSDILRDETHARMVLDVLINRADDPQANVRLAAMKSLQKVWPLEKGIGLRKKLDATFMEPEWPAKLVKFLNNADNEAEFEEALGLLDNTVWQTQPQIVLKEFLDALEDHKDAKIRARAAKWLEKKASEIAEKESFDSYKRVAETLDRTRHEDPDPGVRDSAKTALYTLRASLQKNHYEVRRNEISSGVDEDDRAIAIKQLSDESTLGSRQAMNFMVKQWVDWIFENKEQRLVEITAEAIRYNRYAVLSLVDQFAKETLTKTQVGNRRSDGSQDQEGFEKHLRVRRRIARQIADMSSPRFFEERLAERDHIIEQLRQHAVPALVKILPEENDVEILEDIARTLAYTQEREAIESLVHEVVSEDRELMARKELMAEYYLKPSKAQSEQAAKILQDAVQESRRTLNILQWLNTALFVVGLAILIYGLYIGLANDDGASRVAGALASAGGLFGIIRSLIKDPLNRIQNAIANMVQMQTAFTSFIWEMNANGTFIQSRYVKNGKLANQDIRNTVSRIENSMEKTIDLVSTYVEEGVQRTIIRIDRVVPVVGEVGSAVTIHGQRLLGDGMQLDNLVLIDHEPLEIEWDGKENYWKDHQVTFTLPEVDKFTSHLKEIEKTVWISLSVDGKETNALPFCLLQKKPGVQELKKNLGRQELQKTRQDRVLLHVPSPARLPSDNVFTRIIQSARDMFVVLYIRYKDRFNG